MYFWPPYYSDFNPIENVWGLMARKMKSIDIMTKSDLIESVKSAWDEIDKEMIEKYIDSMPGRINDCISIHRNKINYK